MLIINFYTFVYIYQIFVVSMIGRINELRTYEESL